MAHDDELNKHIERLVKPWWLDFLTIARFETERLYCVIGTLNGGGTITGPMVGSAKAAADTWNLMPITLTGALCPICL